MASHAVGILNFCNAGALGSHQILNRLKHRFWSAFCNVLIWCRGKTRCKLISEPGPCVSAPHHCPQLGNQSVPCRVHISIPLQFRIALNLAGSNLHICNCPEKTSQMPNRPAKCQRLMFLECCKMADPSEN